MVLLYIYIYLCFVSDVAPFLVKCVPSLNKKRVLTWMTLLKGS